MNARSWDTGKTCIYVDVNIEVVVVIITLRYDFTYIRLVYYSFKRYDRMDRVQSLESVNIPCCAQIEYKMVVLLNEAFAWIVLLERSAK